MLILFILHDGNIYGLPNPELYPRAYPSPNGSSQWFTTYLNVGRRWNKLWGTGREFRGDDQGVINRRPSGCIRVVGVWLLGFTVRSSVVLGRTVGKDICKSPKQSNNTTTSGQEVGCRRCCIIAGKKKAQWMEHGQTPGDDRCTFVSGWKLELAQNTISQTLRFGNKNLLDSLYYSL